MLLLLLLGVDVVDVVRIVGGEEPTSDNFLKMLANLQILQLQILKNTYTWLLRLSKKVDTNNFVQTPTTTRTRRQKIFKTTVQ